MKHLLLIILSFVCVICSTSTAHGCQCYEYEVPVCAAFWRADAVFVGQLADIRPIERKADDLPLATLQFLVEQPYRGVSGAHIEVVTTSGTMCDMKFQKGKRYLVYADFDEDTKQLVTGFCSRTTALANAEDDLAYLRKVTQQGVDESVSGKIAKNQTVGLPDLKIEVEGNDKTFETTTDPNGNFSFSLPGPGKYKVRVFVQYAAGAINFAGGLKVKTSATDTLTTIEYNVTLEKNQCNYTTLDVFKIDLHATAVISGHVLTASGQPVTKGFVHLVDIANANRDYVEKLADDGGFKFEEIAGGEYYLVLNRRNEAPDNSNSPYPRSYYPNASESRDATRIVVTEGAELKELVLRVGPQLPKRRVSGIVLWKDGRALEDANVSVYAGSRYLRRIELDKKGRFDFVIYGDFDYSIEASDYRGEIQGSSERLKIPSQNSTDLKLVLRRVEE